MAEQFNAPAEINVDKVVRYLNSAFAKATAGMGKALAANKKNKTAATPLYTLQVEFAHMIDEIQRGPNYIVPKTISEANEFIDQIRETRAAEAAAKPAKGQKRA
ncbi:hypothetical protein D3C75_666250 [compost metagenome]